MFFFRRCSELTFSNSFFFIGSTVGITWKMHNFLVTKQNRIDFTSRDSLNHLVPNCFKRKIEFPLTIHVW